MMIHWLKDMNPAYDSDGLALTIGFFDGLHKGHKLLIQEILNSEDLTPSVMTFETDFKSKLFHDEPELLLTEKEKENLLFRSGIQHDYILPSLPFVYQANKEDFLSLLRKLNVKKIVVGEDFTFGYKGAYKAKDFLGLEKEGVEVKIIPLLEDDGIKVSSSYIRNLLKEGKPKEASSLLGYPFFLKGKVIHGLENGRKLGFPTANITYPKEKVKLKVGVYKTKTQINGKIYPSMTNVGDHPTIEELSNNIVETYIIGFQGDLYGKEIKVSFVDYLRDQKKFSSLDELKNQLAIDEKNSL